MSGKQEQQPRWKRSLSTVNGALGEAVGQMYVAKYFPASSKEKMLELVGNLQKALSERIAGLEWMSDETKAKAQEKLSAFIVKTVIRIRRDYTALEIKDDSYWANVCRLNIFEMDYMLQQAGKPVDQSPLGNDTADSECLLQPDYKRNLFPGSDPSTSFL